MSFTTTDLRFRLVGDSTVMVEEVAVAMSSDWANTCCTNAVASECDVSVIHLVPVYSIASNNEMGVPSLIRFR